MYVLFCVPVEKAVEAAHQAVMFNMGQVCCAGSRTYVHESIYEDFVRRSAERAARRTTGDPFDPKNENGPQVECCHPLLITLKLSFIQQLHLAFISVLSSGFSSSQFVVCFLLSISIKICFKLSTCHQREFFLLIFRPFPLASDISML